jgi:DNA sulfur modification protein DndD
MILDNLVLENVGTFRGKQTLALTPPSPQKPVILVGGLNGAGKTTILESIHLALYGSLSLMPGRRTGSYENYLRSLIHHGVDDSEGAAVDLTFHVYQQGEKHTYRVRRRWRSTGASVRETLFVWVDGKRDEALTSTWSEHVENYLPRGISGLFFFDGEQIEALADLDRSRQALSSALAALLGLDVIDRLATDLTVLRRRHRGAEVPQELRFAVEERQKTATSTRLAEEEAAATVAAARVEAERANKRLHEVTERYRSAGGELLEQRDAAETRVEMGRQQLHDLDEELCRESADVAPLLQVTSLLDGLTQQSALEQVADRDQAILDVVTNRDREVLDRLRAGKVRAATVATVQEFLAADIASRQTSSEIPRISGIRDPAMLEALRANVLPQARTRLTELIERRRALNEQLGQAERALVAIPDPEALSTIKNEMEEASQNALRCHASLMQAEDQLGLLRQERARADTAYEVALDKSAQASLAVEDDHRLVEHVDRVHATLGFLKTKATERHVGRISRLILDALTQLLRKDALVSDVRIDPISQNVELSGPNGRPISASELSAGERQLLAVALLWGLAQAAGQPLPMVIDTPLGRLDGSHRDHLITRYFPRASHQVVLLSTDTEIDKNAFDSLRPQVGRTYRLDFDTAANATAVKAGYFWE